MCVGVGGGGLHGGLGERVGVARASVTRRSTGVHLKKIEQPPEEESARKRSAHTHEPNHVSPLSADAGGLLSSLSFRASLALLSSILILSNDRTTRLVIVTRCHCKNGGRAPRRARTAERPILMCGSSSSTSSGTGTFLRVARREVRRARRRPRRRGRGCATAERCCCCYCCGRQLRSPATTSASTVARRPGGP